VEERPLLPGGVEIEELFEGRQLEGPARDLRRPREGPRPEVSPGAAAAEALEEDRDPGVAGRRRAVRSRAGGGPGRHPEDVLRPVAGDGEVLAGGIDQLRQVLL